MGEVYRGRNVPQHKSTNTNAQRQEDQYAANQYALCSSTVAFCLAWRASVERAVRGLHVASGLPDARQLRGAGDGRAHVGGCVSRYAGAYRSEEHTSELQSLMRISYAVFCLKKKNKSNNHRPIQHIITINKLTEHVPTMPS